MPTLMGATCLFFYLNAHGWTEVINTPDMARDKIAIRPRDSLLSLKGMVSPSKLPI